jgi:hypothetical protein
MGANSLENCRGCKSQGFDSSSFRLKPKTRSSFKQAGEVRMIHHIPIAGRVQLYGAKINKNPALHNEGLRLIYKMKYAS